MGQSVINYFCRVLADKGLKDSKQLQRLYIWKLFATGDGLDRVHFGRAGARGEEPDRCVPASGGGREHWALAKAQAIRTPVPRGHTMA